jgi:hypothetical protein
MGAGPYGTFISLAEMRPMAGSPKRQLAPQRMDYCWKWCSADIQADVNFSF